MFLRSTVDENRREFRAFLDKRKNQVVISRTERERVLKRLGLFAEKKVVIKIGKGPFRANAPSTIRMKGSSKPLINTGRMRQSITSKVVK